MMAPAEKGDKEKKKKGILDRLPRLSRASQTILILAMLVAMFVPTYLIYYQQPRTRASLQASLASYQKILAVEETPKARLEAELKKTEQEAIAVKASYPDPVKMPELVERLIGLAKENGITVTGTKVNVTTLPPPKETSKDKGKTTPTERIDTILNIELGLKGQVAMFQNFLLALDKEFPTTRIKKVSFTIRSEEGQEDTSELSLLVLCYPQEKTE